MSSPLIEQGVAALRAGDSATARRAFELAVAELECGSALEGLAEALYLEGEYSAAAGCYERAYTAYRRERQQMAAGRAARTVSWIAGNLFGDWAVGNGWLGRARTILTEAGEDSPERGWVRIIEAFAEPDVAARETLLRDAIAIGRRFGNADIEFEALVCLGGVFVMTDRVEEGLVLIDEALAAVCAGELVELVAAALCRAHYGGILTAAGRWDEAEAQLVESARQFGRGMPQRRAVALIRLADLRVRQGRLEEAAGLLEGLDIHPDAVRALAALHLARGETVLARDLLERSTAGSDGGVPTVGETTMVGPLLALLVDVYLDEGNARRLARIAEAQRGPYLTAAAALATGACA